MYPVCIGIVKWFKDTPFFTFRPNKFQMAKRNAALCFLTKVRRIKIIKLPQIEANLQLSLPHDSVNIKI